MQFILQYYTSVALSDPVFKTAPATPGLLNINREKKRDGIGPVDIIPSTN